MGSAAQNLLLAKVAGLTTLEAATAIYAYGKGPYADTYAFCAAWRFLTVSDIRAIISPQNGAS